MKNILYKLTLLTSFLLITSCNNKKETDFTETVLYENYKINIPNYFEKTEEGFWEYNKKNHFIAIVDNNLSSSIHEDLEAKSKKLDDDEFYKGKKFMKSEDFEENGFKGKVNYYEKIFTGKGLGLVSVKAYIVLSIVQDAKSKFFIYSFSVAKATENDIVKSIKSLKKISKNKNGNASNFNETKAHKEGFQIFKDENFIIKCKGKLLLDKLRIEQAEQNGQSNNSKPFHVFVQGVDYNINVSDLSSVLKDQTQEELIRYNQEDLTYYQTKFDEMEIKNQRAKLQNIDAVYYQENKLTKAVYFHHKMKSYMLQVTSKKDTDKLFNEFVNSFSIINN